MTLTLNKTAVVDTGFWIALLDGRDQYHASAEIMADYLMNMRYVVVWPTMYETLRTRFLHQWQSVKQLELLLKRPNAQFFEDDKYRQDALEMTFSETNRFRSISLVDHILRLIVADNSIKVDYLYTFNKRDFEDVCRENRVEII
jgi:predicted nucleic acid-binding protein